MNVPKELTRKTEVKACRLLKSLYGLREAPIIWYKLLSEILNSIGLKPMETARFVFRGHDVIVLIYVDDLLIIAETEDTMSRTKTKLLQVLPSKDLGISIDFLGMKLNHGKGYVQLSQDKYVEGLIREHGLETSAGSKVPSDPAVDLSVCSEEAADVEFPYRSIVGSLMYIATHTRPDITVSTSMLAKHVESPSMKHQQATVKLLRYLKSTCRLSLTLRSGDSDQLSCYVDSNWAGERGTG